MSIVWMRPGIFGAAAFCIALILAGCNKKRENEALESRQEANDKDGLKALVFQVAPFEFTQQDDLKRLLPHLGLTGPHAVTVKLPNSPPKLRFELIEEHWQDGKITGRNVGLATSSEFRKLSFSIKEIDSDLDKESKERRLLRSWTVDDVGSFRGIVKVPPLHGSGFSGAVTLKKLVEFGLGDEPAVWAYTAGKGTEHINGGESIEATAKRVEWCLMLKLRITEAKAEDKP
jgi:hypothetical protein